MSNKARFLDGVEYLRVLKPLRIWNAVLIFTSYFLSKWTKRNLHKGDPIAISIEPTTSCNLRCPECPSGLRAFSRPIGMLERELNQTIVDELKHTLTYITYYFQGEPFLNPHFTEMVAYASRHRIYTATSTNAHYLTEENCNKTIDSGLNRLIISIDGIEQDSYGKYRIGGSLSKVIEGTKNIVRLKKERNSRTPFIIWQFIVFKHNEHELEGVRKLADEVGVDELAIKTAQFYNFEVKEELIPTNEAFSRYKKEQGKVSIKNKLLNHCWRMWHACVITWDGKVAPCCFDKDAKHQLGSVQDNSFRSVWRNPQYQTFRKLVLKSRSNIDICRNCSEGTKIWS